MPAAPNPALLAKDPVEALVGMYFNTIPDAFRRPNSMLFEWLGKRFETRGVRGVLYHAYPWCDLWRAEAQRLRQCCRLPFVEVPLDDRGAPNARTVTRIAALLETLR